LWADVAALGGRPERNRGQRARPRPGAPAARRKDQARQAYRQAVAALKPIDNNAFVRELVREALREFGLEGPEAEVLLDAAATGAPPAALTEAIQSNRTRPPDTWPGATGMAAGPLAEGGRRRGCGPPAATRAFTG